MTNYLHQHFAVDPVAGNKYRVTFPEKRKADAGSIVSWRIYKIKSVINDQVYDWDYGVFRDTGKPVSVIFEEHPNTIYKIDTFSFYPVIEELPK